MAKAKSAGVKKLTCLHCKNKPKSRGCCDSCRITLFSKIRAGEFTEDEAIADGWLLPRQNLGRKPKNDGFAKKFQAMKKLKPITATSTPGSGVRARGSAKV